ncbi:homoserine dehydrogenase [Sulfobacillus harzensis]|uniref:Homoserine dehydrogenase n=1 Tax=Sulfobacillus harzensis TaxID=2729629 RepID=A0A7Y0Q3C9_9FIRM|nr:homoserine dehydrogenase [Sulfobacillus harzensis]NMP22846.1 homoserine dehydrogenase [Sulfobacillus harzensis]
MPSVRIGLIGFGTVGQAIVALNRPWRGVTFEIVRAVVRDLDRPRPVHLPLTTNPQDVLDDPTLDIIVEVAGGLDKPKEWIARALANGKAVVTANKEVMARHGADLLQQSQEWDTYLGFEASVAGGIPVVESLEHHLTTAPIQAIGGVLNGTSNFLLSSQQQGANLERAIREAQALGYAEANPASDLSGADAARKLTILCWLAFGVWLDVEAIPRTAIQDYPPAIWARLQEAGFTIRPWADATLDAHGAVSAFVAPIAVSRAHPAFNLVGPQNGVWVRSHAGTFWLQGPGAGGLATATSIWSDIRRSQVVRHPLAPVDIGPRVGRPTPPTHPYLVVAVDPDRAIPGERLGPGLSRTNELPAPQDGLWLFPLLA